MSDVAGMATTDAVRVSRPIPDEGTGRLTCDAETAAADAPLDVPASDLVPLEVVRERGPDPLYHFVWLALSVGVIALAAILTVRSQTQVLIPLTTIPLPELCVMRRWLGLGCPGCGMTRCFIALAHGDLAAAWSYNPAGLMLFGVIAAQVPLRSLQLWRIRRGLAELSLGPIPHVVLSAVAVIMVGQWLLRLCGASW